MKKPTLYQQEYAKYINTYAKYPSIMPCFLTYLQDRRDEAGTRKNWKEYERFTNLIDEDKEQEDFYVGTEDLGRSDADPGL